MVDINKIIESHLFMSFCIGLICFLIVFIFSRSRKSWWDAIAARKLSFLLKLIIILELFIILPLIYCVVDLGSPVILYSHGFNYIWTFGYGRPIFGILCMSLGIFSDMHALARYICVLGTLGQAGIDAMSSSLVKEYITQVKRYNAPTQDYTMESLHLYYWRDIVSFGFCVWIMLSCLHLSCIVGWFQPQLISYPSIAGGDIDRPNVFLQQRKIRQVYDYLHDPDPESLNKLTKSRLNKYQQMQTSKVKDFEENIPLIEKKSSIEGGGSGKNREKELIEDKSTV